MIELRWLKLRDTMHRAEHGDWRFDILRVPNYSRAHPAMVYDFEARAYYGGQLQGQLGTHAGSKLARQACADFVNSKTTEGQSA